MQHSFLKLLPVPVNLGARLAMFLVVIGLVGLVFTLLTLFDIFSLAPVNMEKTFAWVVLVGALFLLFMVWCLWLIISREVLLPLERIKKIIQEEVKEEMEQETEGLGVVVAKVEKLREMINRTQAELDESHENLRQVAKLAMVGKLAAGIAHSVRNPLTSVKLRLFSLERSLALTRQQQEDFVVIAEAMRHVDNIVSNFLEFSRRPQIRLQRVRISAVVEASLKLLENRLLAFPVSTSVFRCDELPEVNADPEQLREVLLNILLNACEAMDYSGALSITQCFHYLDDQHYACIRIQDSGPGVDQDSMPHLFVPFFSTKEQGTGLGLPIAKGILEEHGGDILVESSPKTGAIFSLLLPIPQKE